MSKKRKIDETTKPTENGNIYQVCLSTYVFYRHINSSNSITLEIVAECNLGRKSNHISLSLKTGFIVMESVGNTPFVQMSIKAFELQLYRRKVRISVNTRIISLNKYTKNFCLLCF